MLFFLELSLILSVNSYSFLLKGIKKSKKYSE